MQSANDELNQGQTHEGDIGKADPADTSGNVDKIRDILFGPHMRDYEARFKHLEEIVRTETSETSRRLESLEEYAKKQFEALAARLDAERGERLADTVQLSREVKGSVDSISRKMHEVQSQSAETADLRTRLQQQSNELRDAMQGVHHEISTLVEQRFQALHSGKADNAALASLFNDLAAKLAGKTEHSPAEHYQSELSRD